MFKSSVLLYIQVFYVWSNLTSFWMISDFKDDIVFHVDKVHLFSHGEILGKVKHDLKTLEEIV